MPLQYSSVNSELMSTQERLPSGLPGRFLSFSFILFLGSLLIYLGLVFGYEPLLKKSIADSKGKLDALGARIPSDKQKSLITFYSQINNLKSILSSHVRISSVASFLEGNTEKRVAYQGLNLSVPERKLSIDGVAGSYDDLVRQLAIYQSAPEVERLSLENSEANGNFIKFRINLTLRASVFKP